MDEVSLPNKCRRWRVKPIFPRPLLFFRESRGGKDPRNPRTDLYSAGRAAFRRTSHAGHCFRSARTGRCVRCPDEIRLDLNVGTVPVLFTQQPAQPVFGEMTQKNPEFGATHNVDDIAPLTNLDTADFDNSAPIQTVSTGLFFTMVPLRSLKAVQKLRLDLDRAGEYLARSGGKFFYFVCRETVDPKARLHARLIFYNGDDPATGSAAGCCAAWMVAHGVAASEEQVMIEQGIEMHRPSRIFVRAKKQDNQVVNVRVGGNCVEVLRGEVTLPIQ